MARTKKTVQERLQDAQANAAFAAFPKCIREAASALWGQKQQVLRLVCCGSGDFLVEAGLQAVKLWPRMCPNQGVANVCLATLVIFGQNFPLCQALRVLRDVSVDRHAVQAIRDSIAVSGQVIHEWLRAADRPDQQRLALGIVRNCTLNGVTLTPVLPVVVDCLLSDAPTVRRQAACCIRALARREDNREDLVKLGVPRAVVGSLKKTPAAFRALRLLCKNPDCAAFVLRECEPEVCKALGFLYSQRVLVKEL